MKPLIIPFFIPNQGCPNLCVFCNQKSITGASYLPRKKDIEKGDGSLFSKDRNNKKENRPLLKEIAFYGGSFTGLEESYQQELLGAAKDAVDSGLIDGIRISTRPDYIDKGILIRLKNFRVRTIELGVQSFSDKVLESSKRGHRSDCIFKACEIIMQFGFKLGIQLMMGLPQDDEVSFMDSVYKTIDIKPDFVRIYPVLVLKGTELEKLYLKGEYNPLTLEETIKLGKEALKRFYRANIPVIRFGLQPTETVNLDGSVIAGPFHPSLRHLVDSEIAFDKMASVIEDKNLYGKSVEFSVPENELSVFKGLRKANIFRLKEAFNLKEISFNCS